MANDLVSTVLAVSSDANDSEVVQNILGEWKVKSARNCAEALFMLRNAGCSVVICDKDLPDGSWRDLLSGMGRLLSAPPLVVMSRHADESLWAEVLERGGFDLLAKPLENEEVQRVIPSAGNQGPRRHFVSHA
jgi:DNA-binding NtrC family response regulator